MVVGAKTVSVLLAQVSAVVLPFFLAPEDFGIFGISIFFVGLLVLVGDFGLGTELIRRTEDFEEALHIAFTMRVILGLVLLGFSAPIGYLAAAFYGDSRLLFPTMVAALAVVVNAWTLVPRTISLRSLDFRRAVIPDQVGKIALASSAIFLATLGFAYWSLVIGSLVGPLVAALIYKYYAPWHVKWRMDRQLAKRLVDFGKFVTLASLATFVAYSIDKVIVGAAIGLTQLGYYLVAYSWAVGVPSSVESVLSGVTYPIFGSIRNHVERIRKAFSEVLRLFGYVGVFIGAGVIVLSDTLVTTVLGTRWTPAIVPMQVLAVAGFCLGWVSICGDLITAAGKPKVVTLISVLGVLLVGTTLVPAVLEFGLTGAALSVSTSLIVLAAISRVLACREVGGHLRSELRDELLTPVVSGTLGAIVTWSVGLVSPENFVGLFMRFLAYVLSYVCFLELATGRRFIAELRSVARLAFERG